MMFRSLILALLCAVTSAQLSIEVPGGFGTIEVREGQEPGDEIERFSQLTRTATGHVFSLNELQSFLNAFCNEMNTCKKLNYQEHYALSLELGGIGKIVVNAGQSPIEAIDDFLVRTKSEGLSPENVQEVIGYFCNMKPCVTTTPAPLEVPIQGMGTVSIAFGEEVADGVEKFAYKARQAGLPITLNGVSQIASRLCLFKTCHRSVNLPPIKLKIQGIDNGELVVPFGIEPCDVIENFSQSRYLNGFDYLSQNDVNMLFDKLCSMTVCTKKCQPVTLNIADGSDNGGITVRIGEEPADAAREYLSSIISKGLITSNDLIGEQKIPENIMTSLCKLKTCHKGLDINPSQLNVENIGSIVIPLGGDPTAYVEDFLDRARSSGHRINADGASLLMENVCKLKGTRGCTTPLDVSSVSLNISGVPDLLVVPFGDEPADAAASWMVQARGYGVQITEPNALTIMENLCKLKKCNKPLDVSPLSINVANVGVLTIPFGEEPALSVTKFLLNARSQGHVLNSETANQIMTKVCSERSCLVPLGVSDYSLDIQGVGRFVVPFGSEPSIALVQFVDEVIKQGGDGLIDVKAANQIMTQVCQSLTCFIPLDVRPVTIDIQDIGTLIVPFGFNPTNKVKTFLIQMIKAGYQINDEMAEQIMQAICQAGVNKFNKLIQYCHFPLDIRPFTLNVQNLGQLVIPFGYEPAYEVEKFLNMKRDEGMQVEEGHVKLLMDNVCATLECNVAVNTEPITLNITDVGVLTVKYGEEPSDVVRKFISHSIYENKHITPEQASLIMENLCSRTKCRIPLNLNPTVINVQGLNSLEVPYHVIPQKAVRDFGNLHRLSVYAMQQVMDQLCTRVPCEPEK